MALNPEPPHTHLTRSSFQVSGIEGNFRNTAENVMRVLRTNKESVTAMRPLSTTPSSIGGCSPLPTRQRGELLGSEEWRWGRTVGQRGQVGGGWSERGGI